MNIDLIGIATQRVRMYVLSYCSNISLRDHELDLDHLVSFCQGLAVCACACPLWAGKSVGFHGKQAAFSTISASVAVFLSFLA